jgi:hypothetical protein
VADVICTAKELNGLLQKHGLTAASKVKKMLAQFDADLLAIHAASRYYVLRLYVHAARNLLISVSQTIKDMKAKAKLAKLVNQGTRKLREDAAADKKDKQRNTTKKKGTRCAKKHSIE